MISSIDLQSCIATQLGMTASMSLIGIGFDVAGPALKLGPDDEYPAVMGKSNCSAFSAISTLLIGQTYSQMVRSSTLSSATASRRASKREPSFRVVSASRVRAPAA